MSNYIIDFKKRISELDCRKRITSINRTKILFPVTKLENKIISIEKIIKAIEIDRTNYKIIHVGILREDLDYQCFIYIPIN